MKKIKNHKNNYEKNHVKNKKITNKFEKIKKSRTQFSKVLILCSFGLTMTTTLHIARYSRIERSCTIYG